MLFFKINTGTAAYKTTLPETFPCQVFISLTFFAAVFLLGFMSITLPWVSPQLMIWVEKNVLLFLI